jgi:hypothetical protein
MNSTKPRRHRIGIYLSDVEFAELTTIAIREQRTKPFLINSAISAYLVTKNTESNNRTYAE